MKVKTSKGFTLAELLIVMAIITVLAAVAIPTFGKQLETARETADAESIRAALADAFHTAYVDYINNGTVADTTVYGATAISFSQTKDDFAYITPKYTVGSSTITATKLTVEGENSAKFIAFLFEEESGDGGIKLKDILTAKATITAVSGGTSVIES